MNPQVIERPSTKQPNSTELVFHLIKQELKSRRFFNTLTELGLDNSHYQPHLDEIILTCIGLIDDAKETFDFYYNVMEKHSRKITYPDSILKHASEAHNELTNEKNHPTRFKNAPLMENEKLEFFKLDDIDRKVLMWLIDHVQPNVVKSWIEYIQVEYKRKKVLINSDKLLKEINEL